MPLIYTEKFADKVDERFTAVGVTSSAMNTDYDFEGAQTIKITSVNTVAMGDYNRATGYGALDPIENVIQTLTMTKDRKFTGLLDLMDEEETKIKAGSFLARQLREVVIPEIETYRFNKMMAAAKANSMEVTATAKPYSEVLEMQEKMDDALIPRAGRILFVTPEIIKILKKDADFILASDIAQNMLIHGQIGVVDGTPVISVPKIWLTDGTDKAKAILLHKSAMISPIKLAEYKAFTSGENQTHSGTTFLGRIYYDAFVLNNKKLGIASLV